MVGPEKEPLSPQLGCTKKKTRQWSNVFVYSSWLDSMQIAPSMGMLRTQTAQIPAFPSGPLYCNVSPKILWEIACVKMGQNWVKQP